MSLTRDKPVSRRPVIIIGAPRSGTNMLRDVLTSLPGVGTWGCDELNALWRHGNTFWPTDELTPDQATGRVRGTIRAAFDRLARRRGLTRVVEKTCANSLRVGFVHRVVPEAKFIFLVRDGRDAVLSALDCWRRTPRLAYLLRKARYVPAADLPFYAARFVRSQVHRRFSQERRCASWGPRFTGIDQMLQTRPLIDVCVAQWSRCVTRAIDDLCRVGTEHCYPLRYEAFVEEPQEELRQLAEFCEIPVDAHSVAAATAGVTAGCIGKWEQSLDTASIRSVAKQVEPLLADLGYLVETPRKRRERSVARVPEVVQ